MIASLIPAWVNRDQIARLWRLAAEFSAQIISARQIWVRSASFLTVLKFV
ncbi:hypothetical protein AB2B41_09770 [Marimonas sp. MJW-29]|uniref:Transposase n=1 Tax=Sulfitobacter sediminis TaxID=3234186 RepID=A0ABV3RMS1_9RHOB